MCRLRALDLTVLAFALIIGAFALPLPAQAQVDETHFTATSRGKAVGVDAYFPHSQGKHPAVILLHGNLGTTAPRFLQLWGERLARAGYAAFAVHYFEATGHETASLWDVVSPQNQNSWVAAVNDAITAIRTRPEVDGERIGLVGFSLGGFVATSAAAENPHVAAVAEQSGGLFASRFSRASHLPPVLILHGAADQVVPVAIAHNLERALRENHREYEIQIYPGDDHGLSRHAREADDRILNFLGRRVRERRPR